MELGLMTKPPVSIHASSREDATSPALRSTIQYAFQSTRPRGRTRRFLPFTFIAVRVSIHASSREDATNPALTLRVTSCFNPRVLAGGRDAISAIISKR